MKKYEQSKTIKIGRSQETHKSSYILIAKALNILQEIKSSYPNVMEF